MLVEDFAWAEIDPVTAEWFYGVVRLLKMCQATRTQEGGFVTELMQSGGEFAFWQQSHDHDLHTVTAMWSALRRGFQSVSETSAPYLYRYLCPVVAENEAGYAIVSEVCDMEQRLAHLGTLTQIGRRFVGRKQ